MSKVYKLMYVFNFILLLTLDKKSSAYLSSLHRVADVGLNVLKFLLGDTWVLVRWVERKQVPEYTPECADRPRSVEHQPPARVSDDEPCQWIRQPNPKTESCKLQQSKVGVKKFWTYR